MAPFTLLCNQKLLRDNGLNPHGKISLTYRKSNPWSPTLGILTSWLARGTNGGVYISKGSCYLQIRDGLLFEDKYTKRYWLSGLNYKFSVCPFRF